MPENYGRVQPIRFARFWAMFGWNSMWPIDEAPIANALEDEAIERYREDRDRRQPVAAR